MCWHVHAGAMYSKLPYEVEAGTYDRVASLWFVVMVAIFQAGMHLYDLTALFDPPL